MQIDNNFIDENCLPKGVKPFPYQYEGIKTLFGKTRFLLNDEAGLGKTCQLVVAVNLISRVKEKAAPLKVLVIGTKSICINLQREIDMWSNSNAEYTIINHDKLISKNHQKLLKNWDIIICDESHRYLKNQKTMRAKMFLQIAATAGRIWLSTATLAGKSAEDYYLSLTILLPELFGKWSKTKFINRYCRKVKDPWSPVGFKYEGFHPVNILELKKVFSVCALKRRKEEVKKDLPPITFTKFYADVLPKDFEDFTDEERLEIKAKIQAGHQLAGNYHAVMQHNAELKIPAVVELLQTYPPEKKVVIFAWHRSVVASLIAAIQKETDRKVDFITGEVTSSEKRQEIIDNFQTGDLNTLVLNMQSGGVGINLTAADTGIYVQFPYTPDVWIQSLNRIHRIGSLEPVQIIKVMIASSIDEDIFRILEDRMKNIQEVGV